MSSLGPVAFYGKIAAEADFVRINAGAFQRAGWDAWFQQGIAELQRLRLGLPSEPVCFVLSGGQGRVCVGAFAPGRDAIERAFPAVVFIEEPASNANSFASWLHGLRSFFARASELARDAVNLTPRDLAARLVSVVSRTQDLSPDLDAHQILATSSLIHLMEEKSTADAAYALTTAICACDHARAARADGGQRAPALGLCAVTEIQRLFWITLACRHMGGGLPSVFWSPPKGAFLLSLAPPAHSALVHLAAPGHPHPWVWPLETSNRTALAQAISKLSPAQAHVLSTPETSLLHILSAFSKESR